MLHHLSPFPLASLQVFNITAFANIGSIFLDIKKKCCAPSNKNLTMKHKCTYFPPIGGKENNRLLGVAFLEFV